MDSSPIDDAELLRRYARERDQDAFAALVQRHVNLVYSVALRQVNGDAHLAADAAQLVFADLARKAGALGGHRVLAGWLFTSARFAAAKLVRGEQRRHAREKEAQLMQTLNENDDPSAQLDWQRVRPVLDEVIGELGAGDREAILLRFFEGRDYASIGAKLNLAANTARMRVERALDKLRDRLEHRGVRSTSAVLATALAHQAVTAAPSGLAATVTGVALAGGAGLAGGVAWGSAAGGATATTFMSITKLQLGLASALAVAGATGYVMQAETAAALREEVAGLRHEAAGVEELKAQNARLARAIADAAELRGDDTQFARLQEEATALRGRLQQLARMEQRQATTSLEGVFDLSKVDRPPAPRAQTKPQYPLQARRAGIGAEVVVSFVVDTNGDVQGAKPVRSSFKDAAPADAAARTALQSEFEVAAVDAVSQWKFQPGQKGGRDVPTHLQVPIVFTVAQK